MGIYKTYVFGYYVFNMGSPKISKPSELRDDLYNTLENVSKGERYVITAKTGDVVLISKKEYDCLVDDLELLKEFEEPVDHSQLIQSDEVFSRLSKKYGFSDAGSLDKKSRKKSK
jgi:prevent-host-death family protein